ncbi:RecB family exonuclease [Rhodococcus sp. NPDC019627]|uniref:RecB family exonuclease n=1 Tax=Rhodococcus TaxID=1827 RepID=UPI00202F4788|nr:MULTISPECIES: RecB family exonuclease [Rhodococcus]MDV7351467.1 RecB family exonuclease [Rhodococcus oxybenzonivorans]
MSISESAAPVTEGPPSQTKGSPLQLGAGTATRRRPALSPSRAGDFKQCPLLYRFRAVDRLPEAPSRAQVKGTVVHAALETLFGLPAAERVPERAVDLVHPSWERMLAETPELIELVPAEEREGFLDEARSLVTAYYGLEDPTRFEAESCELRVETELADGVLLRGFVDRIDVAPTGEVRVVDYKTGRAPREMSESKALFQMKFYALVLLRTRGIVPAQLRLLYLASGIVLTYAPDEDELLRFERTLSAIWKAILTAGATGDFRPKPSRLCDWCDHKALCPSFGGTPPPYPGWPEGPAEETPGFEEIVE